MNNKWEREEMKAMENAWKRCFETLKSYSNSFKMVAVEYVGRGLKHSVEITYQLCFMCRSAGIGV